MSVSTILIRIMAKATTAIVRVIATATGTREAITTMNSVQLQAWQNISKNSTKRVKAPWMIRLL